jgi:hypothetical protein
MRDIRLGDDIDDFCVRCKRVMNHAVVSVIAAAPAKVRCRTCHSDHDYRHEQAPPPKVDARKAALFQEVLKKVSPDAAAVVVDDVEIEAPDAEIIESDGEPFHEIGLEVGHEIDHDGVGEAIEEEQEAPPPVVEVAPAPKAKAAKARGRTKK